MAALPYLEGAILDQTVKRITVVGYSHGAALALLCYDYIYDRRPDLRGNLAGYGFGSPRVFKRGHSSSSLRERFESFHYYTNRGDIVTHLPLWLFGFRHVKKPDRIGKKCAYSMTTAHRPESYQRELALAAENEKKGAYV